ncbi:hypothetical protein Ciccas_012171 [Cichlidogyrus casuarinus]|uniref:Integrase catalytic domain-containing protein n=1 Tax=Cichlidogyrus casuarinus TaxID=1844966 RepID=A0ABD2PQF6_9PLAT
MCKHHSIEHVKTPPGHHESNGRAEMAVKQIKNFLAKSNAKTAEKTLFEFSRFWNFRPSAGGSPCRCFLFQTNESCLRGGPNGEPAALAVSEGKPFT